MRCRGRAARPAFDAATSDDYDDSIRASHNVAIAPMGNGVRTPIIHLGAAAFFGPVMTGVPHGSEALRVFDGLRLLAGYPRLFEIKRPLRAALNSIHRARRRTRQPSQREEQLMEREQSWQVITEQRLGLAQLLEGCPRPSGSSRHCARDGASATSQRT